jgi:hypothetical protein
MAALTLLILPVVILWVQVRIRSRHKMLPVVSLLLPMQQWLLCLVHLLLL